MSRIAFTTATLPARKRIALVAHDHCKGFLLDWAKRQRERLAHHDLVATGTTGMLLREELGMPVESMISGPLGGDQQIGARIAERRVDILVFFWDPFEPQPHDPDIKALLRVAAVWNIPVACNESSADYLLSSALLEQEHECRIPDYASYLAGRSVPQSGP
ncbi:methylglyoxal synthase [Pseudomonas indica]|jgi:methylglyoxal synthase|uniref:Methylglyoxal synthase n=1 Tax=Pseudomonas indica TaxID=137658 RepID=A0A1G8YMK7_9PSED|nr:methylglyoxal synthase [Pseudomonas indica]MBU3057114.1 methylglyoxal synthase [Pseudomonas indica]PAU62122.1 methylglyoxal synthase [Pseudomonas indica]SDK03684.1 methylglyoxal synthase [Pseudomonas indica]